MAKTIDKCILLNESGKHKGNTHTQNENETKKTTTITNTGQSFSFLNQIFYLHFDILSHTCLTHNFCYTVIVDVVLLRSFLFFSWAFQNWTMQKKKWTKHEWTNQSDYQWFLCCTIFCVLNSEQCNGMLVFVRRSDAWYDSSWCVWSGWLEECQESMLMLNKKNIMKWNVCTKKTKQNPLTEEEEKKSPFDYVCRMAHFLCVNRMLI